MGCHTHKILSAIVTSKYCSVCSAVEAKGEENPDHECPRNYRGSAKGMESDEALYLIQERHRESATEAYIEAIVVDDDSSMRAVLSHQESNKKREDFQIVFRNRLGSWTQLRG